MKYQRLPTRFLVFTSVFTAIGFVAVMQLRQGFSYSEYLLLSLNGAIEYDNKELSDYIKNEVLVPPSSKGYNLVFDKTWISIRGPVWRQQYKKHKSPLFYDAAINYLFANKRGGWFVEAGALDGELTSNSLYLEMELGWTGLLVEADERQYNVLKQKHRKAWSANVCLATHTYPSKELFILRSFDTASMNTLASHNNRKVHHIDLLSLDVEGAELDILNTIDFKLFTFDVIFLELIINKSFNDIRNDVTPIMESRGFTFFLSMDYDFIFIRRGSPYHKTVVERGPVVYDGYTDTIRAEI